FTFEVSLFCYRAMCFFMVMKIKLITTKNNIIMSAFSQKKYLKELLLVLGLLMQVMVYSQGSVVPMASIDTDMPEIAPPSSTVAALMKFEEIPVDNYTGIPNISIPL